MNKHPYKSTKVAEKYFHLKLPDGKGFLPSNSERVVQAVTGFARQMPDGSWMASFAECDSRDQFCRSTGRNVARRKWFHGKRIAVADSSYEAVMGRYTVAA